MNSKITWDEIIYVVNGADEDGNPRSAANIIIYRADNEEISLENQCFLKGAELNLYAKGACAVLTADFNVSHYVDYQQCKKMCITYLMQEDRKELSVILVPLLLKGNIFAVFHDLVFADGYKDDKNYRLILCFECSDVQIIENTDIDYEQISFEALSEVKRLDVQYEMELSEAIEEEKKLLEKMTRDDSFDKLMDDFESMYDSKEINDYEDRDGYRFSFEED